MGSASISQAVLLEGRTSHTEVIWQDEFASMADQFGKIGTKTKASLTQEICHVELAAMA